MGDKIKEIDVAKPIVEWLKEFGYDVYQEVCIGGPRPDIVAVNEKITWIIEVKTSFSMALLEQAFQHLYSKNAMFVSIATPQTQKRNNRFIIGNILKPNKIGFIEVNTDHSIVEEILKPSLIRTVKNTSNYFIKNRNIRHYLHEEHKTYSVAGSASGDYWSPFKSTCRELLNFVKKNPECTIKEGIDGIKHHYSSHATAISSMRHWILQGKVKDVVAIKCGNKYRLCTVREELK